MSLRSAHLALLAALFGGLAVTAAAQDASRAFVTKHTGTFNGQKVTYVVTVGETVLRDASGAATASFFSTAYVRDGAEDHKARPVLFLFNGGPGSASAWLHLGAFGPKRVALPTDVTAEIAPPYRLIDNGYTVLDVADLVFIDPAETGFSRVLGDSKREPFYTTGGDARSVAQFIQSWIHANHRERSPKFVLGESYGTIRAVLVAGELARDMPLTGVILFGQAVNIVETVQRSGNIVGYATNLPALAAIAWYHSRVDRHGKPVQTFIEDAYAFGMNDYLLALSKGRTLPADERERVARRLSELTGLSAAFYLENDLAISKERFRTEILKDQGLIVGQYDGRYTAPAPTPGEQTTDPSLKMSAAFTTLAKEYFATALGVNLSDEYRPHDTAASVWNWGAPASPFSDYNWPATIARVMKQQPAFRLMIGTGIYDTTTTIGPARYLVMRSDLPTDRVTLRDYDGGHMAYTNEAALQALTQDVRAFVQPPRSAWVSTADDARLAAFLDKAWQEDLDRDPTRRTELGIGARHDAWTPVSDGRIAENEALAKTRLRELRRVAAPRRLSPQGKLNYRLFEHQLRTRIRDAAYRRDTYFFTRTAFDPYLAIPQVLIADQKVATVLDAEDYIARLNGLPRILDDALAGTVARAKRGIVLPAFNFADIARNSTNFAAGSPCDESGSDQALWADAKTKFARLEAPAERTRLLDAARATIRDTVCPAYRRFAQSFTEMGKDSTRTDGIWALPNGDRLYREAIALSTTLEVDPADVHETGLREVARIEQELRAVMSRAGLTGTTREFFERIRRDPRYLLPATAEGRAAYLGAAQKYIDQVQLMLPQYFSTLPQRPVVARAVEPSREKSLPPGSAFYNEAPGGEGPGIFYVNLVDPSAQPLWALESLTYHEAIPGHHLQIAIAHELKGLPEFRAHSFNGAYAEGWALYAEKLGGEMGGFTDDYARAGQLEGELVRAIRLVVETGVHYKRWSWNEAARYMAEHRGMSLESARSEMTRYINWPGQGVSYKLGELEIGRLRRKARGALGTHFDIRGFHSTILDNGPLPFSVLEEMVDVWIEAQPR